MPFLMILTLALMIGALIDIITRDHSQVKYLPKTMWVCIVIMLPLIGSGLWFALGREYGAGGVSLPRMPQRAAHTMTQPPVQQTWAHTADTRTTEQQMEDLDREIEEWRLRQELDRRRQKGDAV